MTLIERLEGGEGALTNREIERFALDMSEALGVETVEKRIVVLRAVNGSLDAALALVEEVLPGAFWSVGRVFPSGLYRASFSGTVEHDLLFIGAPVYAPTPARAVLAALLKAKDLPHD